MINIKKLLFLIIFTTSISLATLAIETEKKLTKDTQKIHILKRIIELHEKQNENLEAIKLYQQVLEINPEDVESMKDLAVHFRSRNEIVKAIDLYSKVVALKPHYTGSRLNLAELLAANGQYNEALEQWEIYLTTKNSKPRTDYIASIIYHGLNEFELANHYFSKVLRKSPKNSDALSFFIEYFMSKKEYFKALEILDKLEKNTNNELPFYLKSNKEECLFQSGEVDAHKHYCQSFIDKNRKTIVYKAEKYQLDRFEVYKRCLSRIGGQDNVNELINKFLLINPLLHNLRTELIYRLIDQGDLNVASKHLDYIFSQKKETKGNIQQAKFIEEENFRKRDARRVIFQFILDNYSLTNYGYLDKKVGITYRDLNLFKAGIDVSHLQQTKGVKVKRYSIAPTIGYLGFTDGQISLNYDIFLEGRRTINMPINILLSYYKWEHLFVSISYDNATPLYSTGQLASSSVEEKKRGLLLAFNYKKFMADLSISTSSFQDGLGEGRGQAVYFSTLLALGDVSVGPKLSYQKNYSSSLSLNSLIGFHSFEYDFQIQYSKFKVSKYNSDRPLSFMPFFEFGGDFERNIDFFKLFRGGTRFKYTFNREYILKINGSFGKESTYFATEKSINLNLEMEYIY